MRDDKIYQMHEADVRRAALLFQQFDFLNTRLLAFETLLSDRKWLFRALVSPKKLLRAADVLQSELLKQSAEKMKAAVEKVKEEQRKPKLTLLGAQANGL